MKTFLKLLALTLCLVMVLGAMVACNGNDSDGSSPSGPSTPQNPSNPDSPSNPDNPDAPSNPQNPSTPTVLHSVYVLMDWDLEDELFRFNIDEGGRLISKELLYSDDLSVEFSFVYNYDSTGKLVSVTYTEGDYQQTVTLTYTDATHASVVGGELSYTFHENGTVATEIHSYDEEESVTVGLTKDGLPAFVEMVYGEDRLELGVSVTVGSQSVCEGEMTESGDITSFSSTFVQDATGELLSFLIEADEGADGKWSYLYEYTYHENGALKQRKCTEKTNGVMDSVDLEIYDEEGKQIENYYYRHNEQGEGELTDYDRTEFTYNEKGEIVLEKMYYCTPDGTEVIGQVSEVEYYENGNKKVTTWSDYQDGIISHSEIRYYREDEDLIIRIDQCLYTNGVLTSKVMREYDEEGNITSEKFEDYT